MSAGRSAENRTAPHEPVLLAEVLEHLPAEPGRIIVDATFGAGGHSRAFLEAGAQVVAIDQDREAERHAERLASKALRLVIGNFRDLPGHLQGLGVERVDGILCDLGVSSMQIDEGERGFAFRQSGPLDMRMSRDTDRSAADIVNELPAEELAAIIYRYGEERHSRRIARAIAERRDRAPITTTDELVETVSGAYPGGPRRDHPARRTFQALRIYVNDELGALEELLREAPALLAPGGRLAVIAYHSLEDRLVKHAFRDDPRWRAVTKRPVTAGEAELQHNPRSRSAKLRVAEVQTTDPEGTVQ